MIETAENVNQLPFTRELYQRINGYFTGKMISKKADIQMKVKIATGLAWWIGSYVLLLMVHSGYIAFLSLYLLHGLAQSFILLNVAHDANHNSISSNPKVNKTLSYLFDLCGINSYMWRILHHRGHHSCMNVKGEDEAILTHGLFRLSPHDPWKKIYRFQHIYAFLIYGIVSLDFVLVKDFYFFYFSGYPHVYGKKHPAKEYIILYAGKIFYIGYMLVIPSLLLPFSPLRVLMAFLLAHMIMGIITTLVFQTTHVVESTQFPERTGAYKHFVYHIFATTADYATKSSWAYWFLGGLHQHVIHHLCPNVCHTHYQELTGIVKDMAAAYDIEYRENRTMARAIVKHFRLLKQLGNHA